MMKNGKEKNRSMTLVRIYGMKAFRDGWNDYTAGKWRKDYEIEFSGWELQYEHGRRAAALASYYGYRGKAKSGKALIEAMGETMAGQVYIEAGI